MKPLSARQYGLRLGACLFGLVALLLISPGVGVVSSSFGLLDAWRAQLGLPISPDGLIDRPFVDLDADGTISREELASYADLAKDIGFGLRFPRSLLALQVGATLALCGAVFQILFRNPLATPYTLGIASGGSLGALVAIKVGWVVTLLGVSSVTLSAFVGAVGVVGAVLLLARGSRRLTSNELLLAGITIGLFCSAMMMVVTVISDERQTLHMVRWMMGSLDTIGGHKSATLWPFLLPAWIVLIAAGRSLDQYRLGDDIAATRGVNVARLQTAAVLVSTIAVAAVVAACGPIGFVGLVVPHIVLLTLGPDSRVLLPASAMIGGAFLILCDWGSQVAMRSAGWAMGRELAGAVLPIGVTTAVVGVPVFLVLLAARTRRGR